MNSLPDLVFKAGPSKALVRTDLLNHCLSLALSAPRHFKITSGDADCKFKLPKVETGSQFVVYKKESSIPQEVTPGAVRMEV